MASSGVPKLEPSPSFSKETLAQSDERVRVAIRVRPPTGEEEEANAGMPVIDVDETRNVVSLHRRGGVIDVVEFEFDAVLPPTATQADVFEVAARPIVMDVMNGYNGTIMAYGQTGAGKTYTLSNANGTELGIIPRAANEVFVQVNADPAHEYRVSMSYIQIYMEMIQDLIRPTSSNMQIRESDQGVYISGVEEIEVKNLDDCLKLLTLGERNRAFAFTKLNAHSSRSHAVAMLTVEKRGTKISSDKIEVKREPIKEHRRNISAPSGLPPLATRNTNEKILVGKLFLVDLAGSERLKKSGSEGLRASEAKSVNLSLTVLGKCINARADQSTHVPFRDSKLTRLLQESLGGNAKTSLVINIAPCVSHVTESLSSLLFGSRAMKVRTKAVVNVEEEYRQLSRNLQETLDMHEERVHSLEAAVFSHEEQLAQTKLSLEIQIKSSIKMREDMEARHKCEMQAQQAEFSKRLRKEEEEARQSMEHIQSVHRTELADITDRFAIQQNTSNETIKSLRSDLEATTQQREALAESLGKTRASLREMEKQVRQLEEERTQEKQHDFETRRRMEREDRAVRRVQRLFRTRRRARLLRNLDAANQTIEKLHAQIRALEAQKAEVEAEMSALSVAMGRKMLADAVSQISASMQSLNRRFLTPKKGLQV